MLKIHSNQSINYLSREKEKWDLNKQKFQRRLVDIHKQLMMFMKIYDYHAIKKRKLLIVLDDMIADMEANKKLC